MELILTLIVFIVIMAFIGLYVNSRKKFKSVVFLVPENTNDMFLDVETLDRYRKETEMNEYLYGGIALEFGKSVFVFDVNACDFFFWVRYASGEPKMEICNIEEA